MTYGMTNTARFGKIREFKIDTFQTVLVDELIPYVDANFRTIAKHHIGPWRGFQWAVWKRTL
jgi:hypothetical protein